ncbi:MAG TPA: branched-chain amino acid ABC transporter permease [Nocardioidaceae bacterium]|nr:branched-chain amino acid ABC transporter permease [Nocardioidaceae bacterium]
MRVRMPAVLALLMGVLFLGSTALPAHAGAVGHAGAPLALAADQLAIQGALVDDTDPVNPEPVEGVTLTVTDAQGKEVGTTTSDADGEYAVPVPGNGAYTITIDPDTLPEGTFLRNPADVEKSVNVLGFDATVQFQIGPDTRDVSTVWEQAIDLFANGLFFGLILALASLGLSMIFGTTGLTNFAHGELVTFGALITLTFNVTIGLPLIAAAAIAVILSGAFGYLQDAGFWRPLRRRGTGLIAMMIVAIGMSIFLRYLYQYLYGGAFQTYGDYVTQETITLGPISVFPKDLISAAVAIVVLVLVAIALAKTRIGKATRAVADNTALSAATGIDVDRVVSVVWIVGTALAGLGGVLIGLSQQVQYEMGFKLLLLIFAAVILGGIGTIWGAMLGSVLIGVFIEMSTLVIPAEMKYVGALGILILVLLFRPQGILGRAQRVG